MLAAQYTDYNGELLVVSVPKPVVRSGDVLVKIHKAAINPIDDKVSTNILIQHY